MRLGVARAFAVLTAVAVCAVAGMAWSEPSLMVLTAEHGLGYCPVHVPDVHFADQQASEDLLLLMFGLSQGRGGLS